MDRRSLGQLGETAVAERLRAQGFEVVARNAKVGRLELDLIARRADLLVFCEVKTSSSASTFAPELRLSDAQRKRLRRAAGQWLRGASPSGIRDVRLDAAFVTVDAQGGPTVSYFEGAF